MSKMLIILVILFSVNMPIFAQTVDTAWVRRYNGPANSGDEAHAIAVDDSGNVYVTGMDCGIDTSPDYATVKYYPNGDTAWVRRYSPTGNPHGGGSAIFVDDDGNVYVTGHSWNYETYNWWDYATIKYYSNGDTGWVRRYNGRGMLTIKHGL